MKRIVEQTEADGLEKLLGEPVILMCAGYFYAGKLIGVNASDVVLSEPRIVYDTGKWASDNYTTEEKLPADEWFVRTASIESYGRVDR